MNCIQSQFFYKAYLRSNLDNIVDSGKQSGANVIGLDWRISLDWAAERLGKGIAVQGNLDPYALLTPVEQMEVRVKEILAQGAKAGGHIFNLGDGIFPEVPVDRVKRLVDMVHRLSQTR